MSNFRITLGRYDRADFPEFGLENLRCKIDTGADTSAVHCHHIKIIEKDGKEFLSFKLLDPEHKNYLKKSFAIPSFSETLVKNTSGSSEFRYVIDSEIVLFGKVMPIRLNLADRSEMKFPVLLGRKFLRENRILVDVSKVNISYKEKRKKV